MLKAVPNYLFLIILLLVNSGCAAQPERADRWEKPRAALLEELKKQKITDERVLESIASVPRHAFVPEHLRDFAYDNRPLPIGQDQTISQPFIVAYMTQALNLQPNDRVLEIGTGSGYHAAVMSSLCKSVYTIEILPELGRRAEKLLDSLGFTNITVRIGDGYQGWSEHAPFDAIILTAAPHQIPQPLLDQLAIGGRLIAPVGDRWQELVLVKRTTEGYTRKNLLAVMFVPMTGEAQKKGIDGH